MTSTGLPLVPPPARPTLRLVRILITGAAGFVGSHVADALIAAGHEVILLDALVPQAHGPEAPLPASPALRGDEPEPPPAHDRPGTLTAESGFGFRSPHNAELVIGDVRDAGLLRTLLEGVDAVCHQAALVGHGLHPGDAPAYVSHNDLGTAVLLATMHERRVRRLVLASSMVIYGEGCYSCRTHGPVQAPPRTSAAIAAGHYDPQCPTCGQDLRAELVTEDTPARPRSTYAATKLAQEHLAGAWARQTNGSVCALRYHNVYGPRMPRDTPYAGVASLFRSSLERGQPPTVLEDGRQLRDFVHVTDVAAANVLALQADLPGVRTFNVCSGEPHTIGELAGTLAGAFGGPAPQVVGGVRAADVRHVLADPAAAAETLGFRAAVPFVDGITRFATDPLRAPAAIGTTAV